MGMCMHMFGRIWRAVPRARRGDSSGRGWIGGPHDRDILERMGRDRLRVLVCGVASIALIIAGTLVLDWYRLVFEPAAGGAVRIAIDLRNLQLCQLGQTCVRAPLTPLPGMFPTLAAVTMWSSLGMAGLVTFQAGFRILASSASDSLTKLGYMGSLMAISIAVATAYLFGPEPEGSMIGAAAQAGVLLHRTWGPLTLIAGLVAGFAALYMAVAPESSDLAASYQPIKPALVRAMSELRTRTPSVRIPFPEHTGTFAILDSGATGTAAGARPAAERRAVGSTQIPVRDRPPSEPSTADLDPPRAPRTPDRRGRPTTDMRAPRTRTVAGIQPLRERTAAGSQPIGVAPAIAERTATGSQPIGVAPATGPSLAPDATREPKRHAVNEPAPGPASDPPPLRERAATGVYAIPALAMPRPAGERSSTIEPARRAQLTTGPLDRELPATSPPPLRERAATGVFAAREHTGTGGVREITGSGVREPTGLHAARERTGSGVREPTSLHAARERPATGPVPAVRPATPAVRPLSGPPATSRPDRGQRGPVTASPAVSPTKTGSVDAAPSLRQRLSYVAITAELTAGGIDARREDGLSRLVLWRDVVGVVARRMPAVYDGVVFIDVVSTAGSTLRIVPWTRLAGDPITAEADGRPRGIVEHVAARCPGAKLDPATRQFLETGTAAQLPDLETLRAHDERLA